jgi:hypothetical protein
MGLGFLGRRTHAKPRAIKGKTTAMTMNSPMEVKGFDDDEQSNGSKRVDQFHVSPISSLNLRAMGGIIA